MNVLHLQSIQSAAFEALSTCAPNEKVRLSSLHAKNILAGTYRLGWNRQVGCAAGK